MLWVRPLFSDGIFALWLPCFVVDVVVVSSCVVSTPPSHVSTLVGGKVSIDFGLGTLMGLKVMALWKLMVDPMCDVPVLRRNGNREFSVHRLGQVQK